MSARSLTCICHYNGLCSSLLQKKTCCWLYHVKPSRGAMEQASGSIMTGIRAFSAHLPFTSLLWTSTAFRLLVYSSYSLSGDLWKPEFDSRIGHHVNNCAMSEWVHAAGLWYNSTLMSCEGKVAVEFVGWT